MATVFKPKDRNKKTDPYVIEYTDHRGKRRRIGGYKDKRLSVERATLLEQDARLRRDGLIDPKEEKRIQQESLPIAEHLAAFKKSISKNTQKHVKLVMSRINRILEKALIESIADFDIESVEQAMDEITEEDGIGKRTYNHYLQALDSFCNWMVPKRISSNPIAGIKRLNAETDIRHPRRALSVDEMRQLMKSARDSNVSIQCFSGKERAFIYLMSFMTGLRRKELGSLTKRSFKLESELPTLIIEAAHSKHRRKDVLPLHQELVPEIKEWLKGMKPDEKLFPKLGKRRTWLMVKLDLERINIPYKTDEGIADFHAAGRHSHINGLLESGASLAETMELARHSDVRMTMKYIHLGLDTKSKALSSLPSPNGPKRESPNSDKQAKADKSKSEQLLCSDMCSDHEPPTCHLGSSAGSTCPNTSPIPKKITPGGNGGYVESCPDMPSNGTRHASVEAAGIEPACCSSQNVTSEQVTVSTVLKVSKYVVPVDPNMSSDGTNWPNEAEVKYLLDAWPQLPPHIRETVITLIDSTLVRQLGAGRMS